LWYLGLWSKSGKIVFLGLDNAGKTTLLGRLKDDRMKQHQPTQQATSEELTLGKMKIVAHDVGGHLEARSVWADFYTAADAVVFIVDAYDKGRFEEARTELTNLLQAQELEKVPSHYGS